MSAYQQLIRKDLAALGLVGRYEPADVEAWMRVEHPTLDHLSPAQFRSEVQVAADCIAFAPTSHTRSLRASYGL